MVKLVTVSTHSDGYFPWLKESCERFNVKLINIGDGQKWLGFSWRFKLMIKYLKTIDPDELVIFIDAYDVIMLRPLDDIEKYYNHIIKMNKCKIIISDDKSINFFQEFWAKFYFNDYINTRINAGSYLGKANDLLEILCNINQNIKDDDDDQILFTTYYKKNQDQFYVDTTNIFFITRCITSKDILKDSNIKIHKKKLLYKNTQPFFIHGSGNTLMHNLILKLGYNISNDEINSIINSYKKIVNKKFIYYFINIIKRYKILLICLLIIIIYFLLNNIMDLYKFKK